MQLYLGLKAHPLPCLCCSVFICRGGRAPQALWQSCEKGNFDRPLCLPWIIPLEGKLIKAQVSREEEEGKQKRDGGATDRYFQHNRLTRARGGAGQGDVFDLCCCSGDTSATSQPCSSISDNSSCSEVNNRWVPWVPCDLQQL